MKVTMNFSLSYDDMIRFSSAEELRNFYRNAGCDGLEVMPIEPDTRSLVLAALLIFDCAPVLLNIVSNFLGIYAPVNMIFFLGFCFSLLIIFSLTVALSRLSNSVRTLDQMVALNEKRLQDLEQKLKKEKEKNEEKTDHHRM